MNVIDLEWQVWQNLPKNIRDQYNDIMIQVEKRYQGEGKSAPVETLCEEVINTVYEVLNECLLYK